MNAIDTKYKIKKKRRDIIIKPSANTKLNNLTTRRYEINNDNLPDFLPPIIPLVDIKHRKGLKLRNIKINKNKIPAPKIKQDKIIKINVANEKALDSAIFSLLAECKKPASKQYIIDCIQFPNEKVDKRVEQLLAEGKLFFSKKMRIGLPDQVGNVVGILQMATKGFGFLIPNDESDDIFIPKPALKNALNGDTVVVKVNLSHGVSREGEIVSVLERANKTVVGKIIRHQQKYYIEPDSLRINNNVKIAKGKLNGAKEGQKVVGELIYQNDGIYAKVSEILGESNEIGIDILSIIKAHEIKSEFDKVTLLEADKIGDTVESSEILLREDLRKKRIFTIDGASAKDFDDAISCDKLKDGTFILGVHIADVSHYVKENKAIDKEAQLRGTSAYFVDRVVPMLPESLSNGICSLNPDVDRLTLSCHMHIDEHGTVLNYRISETAINSKRRLVYDDVTAALEGDKDKQKEMKPLMQTLKNMQKLSEILHKRRQSRGSIDFDIPEAEILLDENGETNDIVVRKVGIANKMIEEFMLVCNETIAQYLSNFDIPALYRVHETPDDEKIDNLKDFLAGFGLGLRGKQDEKIKPKALQTMIEKVKGRKEEKVISKVLLRSLKKAKYFEDNLGHFGLAAKYYCHFTSPIRRYPDLIVHRMLKLFMSGRLSKEEKKKYTKILPQIAKHTSERERAAMEAEREVDDLKKCEYMAQHINEEFKGNVSGLTATGVFVELENTCEGFIHLTEFKDDYYFYEEKKYRLVGKHTGKIINLGDEIDIVVASANVETRRVDFKLKEVN